MSKLNRRLFWFSPPVWAPLLGLVLWTVLLVATLSQINQPFPGFRVGHCRLVSDFNEPRWTGLVAGLRSGDLILKADGQPVADGEAIFARARALPLGTPVTYELQRGDKSLTIAVPTARFGFLDFWTSFGIYFVIALLMMAIGATAAWLKPDNKAAVANLWLAQGMALSFVFNNDYDLTHRLHPDWYFGAVFLYAAAALSMAFNFPEEPAWLARRRWLQALPYVVSGVLFAVTAWMFAQSGLSSEVELFATGLSFVWPTLVLIVALGVFAARLRGRRDSRGRTQIRVLLLGIAVAYLPVVLVDMVPRALFGTPPWPVVTNLSYAFRLFFPLALAYAIIKHNLFDISIIIKKTTVYASLTAFLVGGYFATAAAVRFLASWLLGLGHAADWENVIATAVIAVCFVPVRQAVTNAVDKLFFRTKYDFREVVARVTTKAQASLDITGMKREFLAAIDAALHPRYLYILSMNPQGDVLATVGSMAVWGDAPFDGLKVPADDPLLVRTGRGEEVEYVPATGLTGMLSPLAALGPHYRVPLAVGEEVVGLVILGPKRSDEAYSAEDRQLLAATRLPLATALKTAALVDDKLFKDRMEQELKRAREVQEAMLPRELPRVAGYEFAASSVPCLEASGDYYDFVELPDGRVGVAVADVAGKGIAAALATAMAKSGLYNQTQTDPEVIPVMTALNRLIHSVSKNAASKSFTTCLYAVLDPAGRQLTFSCAGHFPPVHYDAARDAVTEFPLAGGFPLGVRDKAKYIAREVTLGPGDVLVFYTDGVTEAQAPESPSPGLEPGEPFESERLNQVVLAHKHESAEAIHLALKQAVEAHVAGGPQTDDITIVVIKVV